MQRVIMFFVAVVAVLGVRPLPANAVPTVNVQLWDVCGTDISGTVCASTKNVPSYETYATQILKQAGIASSFSATIPQISVPTSLGCANGAASTFCADSSAGGLFDTVHTLIDNAVPGVSSSPVANTLNVYLVNSLLATNGANFAGPNGALFGWGLIGGNGAVVQTGTNPTAAKGYSWPAGPVTPPAVQGPGLTAATDTLAHELVHNLGLDHVDTTSLSTTIYNTPNNLMNTGSRYVPIELCQVAPYSCAAPQYLSTSGPLTTTTAVSVGSTTLTLSSTAGVLPGMLVTPAPGVVEPNNAGIPGTDTVKSVAGNVVTLTKPLSGLVPTGTVLSFVQPYSTGALTTVGTSSGTTLNLSSVTSGATRVQPTMVVTGPNVPYGDTVLSVSGNTVTLAAPLTGSVVAGKIFTFASPQETDRLVGGTPTLTVTDTFGATLAVNNAATVHVGMAAVGTGIPNGDTVTNVSGNSVTLATAPVVAVGSQVWFDSTPHQISALQNPLLLNQLPAFQVQVPGLIGGLGAHARAGCNTDVANCQTVSNYASAFTTGPVASGALITDIRLRFLDGSVTAGVGPDGSAVDAFYYPLVPCATCVGGVTTSDTPTAYPLTATFTSALINGHVEWDVHPATPIPSNVYFGVYFSYTSVPIIPGCAIDPLTCPVPCPGPGCTDSFNYTPPFSSKFTFTDGSVSRAGYDSTGADPGFYSDQAQVFTFDPTAPGVCTVADPAAAPLGQCIVLGPSLLPTKVGDISPLTDMPVEIWTDEFGSPPDVIARTSIPFAALDARVPEPAGLLVLGTAIGGLTALRRRRGRSVVAG